MDGTGVLQENSVTKTLQGCNKIVTAINEGVTKTLQGGVEELQKRYKTAKNSQKLTLLWCNGVKCDRKAKKAFVNQKTWFFKTRGSFFVTGNLKNWQVWRQIVCMGADGNLEGGKKYMG